MPDAVQHAEGPPPKHLASVAQRLAAKAAREAAEHAVTPEGAPPLPQVQVTRAPRQKGVARQFRQPSTELRDLDAAFRGRFFALFDDEKVMARIKGLILSEDDKIVIEALKVILPNIPVQRRDSDGAGNGPINLHFGIPRAAPVDVTPR